MADESERTKEKMKKEIEGGWKKNRGKNERRDENRERQEVIHSVLNYN